MEKQANEHNGPITPTPRDLLRIQIVELASGDITGVRAWWLRMRIARDRELTRELAETRKLWNDLSLLRAVEPAKRPAWPTEPARPRPTVTFGGKKMDRRVFLLAYGSLLLAATGTYLLHDASKLPRQEVITSVATKADLLVTDEFGEPITIDTPEARNGPRGGSGAITFDYEDIPGKAIRWRVDAPFVGEARLLDTGQKVVGSTSHADDLNRSDGGSPQAWVTVNEHVVLLKTAIGNYQPQRFTFRNRQGAIIGYVELAPTAPAERQREMDQHMLSLGIEERFEGSSGARDGNGEASGFFEPTAINRRPGGAPTAAWNFKGVGEVRIRRANGKVLRRGFAAPEANAPTSPILEWNNEGKVQTFPGYGTYRVKLPNGEPLVIDVLRWEERWQPRQ